MKKTILFSLLCIWTFSESKAEIALPSQNCEVEMISMGKGTTTPLHQEAELVLRYKGYNLRPALKTEAIENHFQSPYSFQVRYKAGNVSPSGSADCIIEDYRALGKRATCQYELKFTVRDEQGIEKTVFELRQSIRQSLELEGFYDRVRSELARLPLCVQLI